MKYSLTKVQDKIWHLTFDCRYDLSMHFLRYQEFYECPNSKFRGKKFTIFEFMKWYSFKYSDGCFEYPIHWAGFNIPIKIFKEIKNIGIDDRNQYDIFMYKIYDQIKKVDGEDSYLIGTYSKEAGNSTFEHEFAHAMYALNKNYKKEMDLLTKSINTTSAYSYFSEMGYTKKVFKDEFQAYASEVAIDNAKLLGLTKQQKEKYVKVYQKYKGATS